MNVGRRRVVRTRVTIAPVGENGFQFLSESSTGDGPWKQGAKVEYRRIGAGGVP